ncbi:MAG TPA: RDD family protein [Patescibacteria group bacterium]|nr:RDD family protein [Patescibacteria group bacterium]
MDNGQLIQAGFWRRAGALLIDAIILGLGLFVLVMVLHVPHRLLPLIFHPACLCYFVLLESATARRATIGKRCMKIFTAMEDGKHMSPGLALWRYVTWILPLVPAIAIDSTPAYVAMLDTIHGFNAAHDHATLVKYMHEPGITEMMMTYVAAGAGGMAVWMLWCIPSMVFGKQKAGMHDLATGTRVFRE